jgi:FkbM family methyltransferase
MIVPLGTLPARFNLPRMTKVVHIGGHFGEECDDYFANGVDTVTFFEPSLPSFLEMHKRHGGRAGVTLVHTALGPYNGSTFMHVETVNGGQSSSLLPAKEHKRLYPQIVFHLRERVTVMRLDDWMGPDETCDFIAIDVQGYELEVFKGAERALNSVYAVSAEINKEELYEGCARVGDLDAFLGQRGFKRALTEWCGAEGAWGEAIYVRQG